MGRASISYINSESFLSTARQRQNVIDLCKLIIIYSYPIKRKFIMMLTSFHLADTRPFI